MLSYTQSLLLNPASAGAANHSGILEVSLFWWSYLSSCFFQSIARSFTQGIQISNPHEGDDEGQSLPSRDTIGMYNFLS